jgi:uncharacterized protein (TIGR03437 family)
MKPLAVLLCAMSLPAQQYRAFWADAFHRGYKTPAQVDQMIDDLVGARANAVFVEVRLDGSSYYLHSLEPPAQDPEYSPTFDALQYVIERAHARGIEVHAWFAVTPLWRSARPPQDPRHTWHAHGPNAPGDQMWMTVSSTGRISTSLDPGHPDAFQYLADVILEPAKYYDLDGIHLDYIRYPEDANYGWNPVAVARFQRLENRTESPDPADPRWSEFRRKQVTDLVRQIYLRAFALKPSIKISAALIAWGDGPRSDAEYRAKDAYSRVFQDWRGWLEEGTLDLGLPMNYFREPIHSGYFDRWIEYEKDRQYRRGIMIGPAAYLNGIPDSLAQLRRALAPSTAGNQALGFNFYSYASTNTLGPDGLPLVPNSEFYRTLAEFFSDKATPPALPWKAKPERGHVYGWLRVEGAPWLADGAPIFIESEQGGALPQIVTDGTGFFGMVDLPPGRYFVRLERDGSELYRSPSQEIRPGSAARFDIFLKAEDFAGLIPRIRLANKAAGPPGDVIVLTGAAFASRFDNAKAVPLPMELDKTQVVVNGAAAPLFYVSPDQIQLQLPYMRVEAWNIVVRNAGLPSEPFRLDFVDASPAILGIANRGDGYVEIYATGLGATAPTRSAGLGGAPEEPYNRTALPVTVWLTTPAGQFELQPQYSGLAPYLPALYQINVRLPDAVTGGEIRLKAGSTVSAAFAL